MVWFAILYVRFRYKASKRLLDLHNGIAMLCFTAVGLRNSSVLGTCSLSVSPPPYSLFHHRCSRRYVPERTATSSPALKDASAQ